MARKSQHTGIGFILLGIVLLVAGLGLVGYNNYDSSRAGKEAQTVMDQLLPQVKDSSLVVPASLDSAADMPTITIDGQRYIGYLQIPSCDLNLPVMITDVWDESQLVTAPCRYSGSYFTNDLVIAGHNYSYHFGPLWSISLGEDVRLVTADGRKIDYVVDNVEILQENQVKEMKTGDWDLTLFTCTLSGQERCTVRCVRSDSTVQASQPKA